MRSFLAVVFFVFFGFVLSSQTISIVSMEGTVQVKEAENSEWILATAGQKLGSGFFIHTGFKSSAVIKSDNIKVEVKPLSQLTVASLFKEGNTVSSDMLLKYGRVKADVQKSDEVKTMFKVRTANSTASVRGTAFTFGDDVLIVERGTVALVNDSGSIVLVSGGESAKAPKMSSLVSPFSETKDGYNVSSLPVGMSEAEANNITAISDSGSNGGNANVIIKINVSK